MGSHRGNLVIFIPLYGCWAASMQGRADNLARFSELLVSAKRFFCGGEGRIGAQIAVEAIAPSIN